MQHRFVYYKFELSPVCETFRTGLRKEEMLLQKTEMCRFTEKIDYSANWIEHYGRSS
jgi:hypothetical protein